MPVDLSRHKRNDLRATQKENCDEPIDAFDASSKRGDYGRYLLAGDRGVGVFRSNLGLERHLAEQGLTLARTNVGDRYVVEHMRANGYNVGGEQSGHIVLSDYTTTGDGLIAALQVLAVVKAKGKPVSEVCHRFDPVPQVLKNVRFSGQSPLDRKDIKEAILDAETMLGNGGRLLIRPSGTEPVIRVMAEADDFGQVEKLVDQLVEVIGRPL